MAVHHPVLWTVGGLSAIVLAVGVPAATTVIQKGSGAVATVGGISVGSVKPGVDAFMAGKAAADAAAAARAKAGAGGQGGPPPAAARTGP